MPRKKKTDTTDTTPAVAEETKPKKVKKTTKAAAKAAAPAEDQGAGTVPTEDKQAIIKEYQVADGDTGSPEVQIALLSARIDKLIGHLKTNPADNHSRRGLLGIVSKRRRLLNYLEEQDKERFALVAKKLGLIK